MPNDQNLLNSISLDDYLYRYMSMSQLFALILEKEIILKNPPCWEDPYEQLIEHIVIEDINHYQISLKYAREGIYAHCWSKARDCDGLWRNFTVFDSKKPDGAMIKTTANKLYNAVSKFDKNNFSTFIGNVIYRNEDEVTRYIQYNFFNQKSVTQCLSEVSMIKRDNFSYEQEVRIIHFGEDRKSNEEKIEIEPLEFIEQILFSPLYTTKQFNIYKNILIELGFSDKIISKSKLYQLLEKPIIMKRLSQS